MNGNKGRLSMAIHPKSYFEGPDAVVPFEDELCYDDETFDIYQWKQDEKGTWHAYSRTASIQAYLNELKDSGIFTSASAFVNNRKIYRFFFDQPNGVVRLDPDLRFDSIYRYYAIRKTTLSASGAYQYITGVEGSDVNGNTITSALVDMTLVDSESGDGTKVSVPQVGGLADTVTNGETYIVEFFDSNRSLVNMQSYQAIAVRTTDLDLSPDTAITDLYFQSTQAYEIGGEDCIYFYAGQNKSQVGLTFYVKFADGRSRDITSEQSVGGRLSVLGLDEITTDNVTYDIETGVVSGEPQTIEVVYQMIRSNASLPSSTTETPTGAVISPSSLTISKTIKVYVIKDVYNTTTDGKIYPAGWVESAAASGTGSAGIMYLKYFAQYTDGTIRDISSIVKYPDESLTFKNTAFGSTQNIKIAFPQGSGNVEKTYNFTLDSSAYSTDIGSSNVIKTSLTGYTKYIKFDKSQTASIYAGKFTGFKIVEDGETKDLSYASMLTQDYAVYKENGVVTRTPTHIRIRDVKDPSFAYTDIVDASGGAYINSYGSGHELAKDRALLVEFYQIIKDDKGNITTAYATGATVVYVQMVTS